MDAISNFFSTLEFVAAMIAGIVGFIGLGAPAAVLMMLWPWLHWNLQGASHARVFLIGALVAIAGIVGFWYGAGVLHTPNPSGIEALGPDATTLAIATILTYGGGLTIVIASGFCWYAGWQLFPRMRRFFGQY